MPIKVFIKNEISVKINELPTEIRTRIKDALKDLETTWPICRLDIKKLKGYDDHYRIRVGSYRILFFREDGTAKVYDVLSRHDAYKGKD